MDVGEREGKKIKVNISTLKKFTTLAEELKV